jgi:uncharacterized protein (UPF0333 family)
MKKALSLIIAILALSILVFPVAASSSNSQAYPYFYILEVSKDQSVTIQVYNAPANDTFRVTMGEYGTQGVGGVVVGNTSTGSGGSFVATYSIPSTLAGREKIAIRLESPTSGYFAYNWFYNNPISSSGSTPIPGYSGYPSFSIQSVVTNESVTITTSNFPPNDTFTVTMGKYGTKGVGGVVVGSTNSGAGGTLTITYVIPDSLDGLSQIAIRLESPTSGYYAYNWFYNNTSSTPPSQEPAPTPTPAPPGYSGYPTISIVGVVTDQSVTISGQNFPPNDSFTVLMGPYGSQAIGGTNVGTTTTEAGGAISATYSIPSSLAGSYKIAIRLQSSASGYYAYNWFYNNSTP